MKALFYIGIIIANAEYISSFRNGKRWAILAGIGSELEKWNLKYPGLFIQSTANWISGRKTHFFEYGAGLGMASNAPFIQLRLGYRLELGQRGLARIGYNPYVYLIPHFESEVLPNITGSHNLSVSLGYRFNIGKK
ncbi:MAG: hypothetical protein K9G76_04795 [Bacteroidales bacterium]|nr:hypothetical protein [Bacteroidales bacterium]MCF8402996.1 hypothetical protein [Bacteroidales bacterium]